MTQAVQDFATRLGQVSLSCEVLGMSRATYYRAVSPPKPPRDKELRPPPENALEPAERQSILDHLHSERFVDRSPAAVFHSLLDEGTYFASVRTFYRILADHDQVRERRAQRRHPTYDKPELIATGPKQVWSWDITKLRGPVKWTYYYLYVIIDIFSRQVVGWMLAEREAGYLAEQLIEETCLKQNIERDQLTIHSDRGPSMQSGPVVHLLARLGITKSNSRPYVSDDNPFSEAQFKTLKYHSHFPGRFGGFEDALAFCKMFFHYYNTEHYHSALLFLTPESVHNGQTEEILAQRHARKMEAYQRHPERFINGPPQRRGLTRAVYINPPERQQDCSLNSREDLSHSP